MTDMPFSPGGITPPPGPSSGLVPTLLKSGEVVGVPHLVRLWLESGLPLEDWLRQRDERGGGDGNDAG